MPFESQGGSCSIMLLCGPPPVNMNGVFPTTRRGQKMQVQNADIKLIKAALEDARFDDVIIREKIYRCIDVLANDMEEVGFQTSLQSDEVFADLEEYLDEEEDDDDDIEEDDDDDDDDDDSEEKETL